MSHMVIYRSVEGQPVFHQVESLEDAARHVETLRNAGQGGDARIFSMKEVKIEVKTYYRVEVASDDDTPKRDEEGRRLGAKEKTRIKKRLVGERALVDLDAWAAGAAALAAE
jgi:hypothetical protein